MPRVYAGDVPPCPPLRAISFDALGLIKAIEVNEEKKIPEVVGTWGKPDSRSAVLVAHLSEDHEQPVLGVARKNNAVDFLHPSNGTLLSSTSIDSEAPVVGLHVFGKARPNNFLACTEKGNAIIKSFLKVDDSIPATPLDTSSSWQISNSGSVLCCRVDGTEKFAAFGGKGIEVHTWDVEKCKRIWTAKAPPPDSLGLFPPPFVTAVTFLTKDDHRKIVIGTGQYQIRLYDIAAQRRPIFRLDFKESPIKVVREDLDGYTVYVGNGTGDLASFDLRTRKLLGCFKGKCSGSIRSIAKHPDMPLIASCGLDRYLRIWDTRTRQNLASVFLKQQLSSVVFDANYSPSSAPESGVHQDSTKISPVVNVDEEEASHKSIVTKRKSAHKHAKKKKTKSRKKLKSDDETQNE
eukprot:TRINITY_DN6186_c0_g1_i1.p1 TRINITY_DN6186_c0_g1~~TRINITY_DN6186_c0_g1_i1.p1  ORF type:complete len:406 (+),score=87.04 TRINITY_DN6186_c0_g1_i1:155-1372(+)